MSLFPLTHLGKLQLIAMAMAKQQAGRKTKKKKKSQMKCCISCVTQKAAAYLLFICEGKKIDKRGSERSLRILLGFPANRNNNSSNLRSMWRFSSGQRSALD